MLNLGFVCSAGGAPIEALQKILSKCEKPVNISVVTDRKCKAEEMCERNGIPFIRIQESSRSIFSTKAADWLYGKKQSSVVVLLFSRLVSEQLFLNKRCINIHPSLLPAFPGINALRQAYESGTKYIGSTAHLVDKSMDGGPILTQVACPLRSEFSYKLLERISFAQKVFLLLKIYEECFCGLQSGGIDFQTSPGFKEIRILDVDMNEAFLTFLKEEGIPSIQ
jgi:phosphoribosylglycinamide formyltransferase-1